MRITIGWRAARLTATVTVLVTLGLSAGMPASAAASPKPGLATAVATVKVNIRAGAGTSYRILGTLDRGQRIIPTSAATHGWVKVRFRGAPAYIAAAYLNLNGRHVPAAPSKIKSSGQKVTTVRLNVRSGAGSSHPVVATLAEGQVLTLAGPMKNGYAMTRSGAHPRWVSMAYLASLASTKAVVPPSSRGRVAVAFARKQLGEPYRFGATGPNAWDCSGLTQASWRAAGVAIPRTSFQQSKVGKRVSRSQLRVGDLVFFYRPRVHHVGLYVGGGKIINAPRPGKRVSYTTISSMPYAWATRPG